MSVWEVSGIDAKAGLNFARSVFGWIMECDIAKDAQISWESLKVEIFLF